MAPVDHLYRLQFGGSLYTSESWSVGIYFNTLGAFTPSDIVAPAVEAFYDALPTVGRHNTAKLGFVKFNRIDPLTGKYFDPGASDAKYYIPEHTSAASPSLLPQGATCVSLTTANARGRGHAGRIYLPGYNSVNTAGKLDAGACVNTANLVAKLINDIHAFEQQQRAVVFSKIAQTVTTITGTRCGDVVDTQRRRRSSLKEVYSAGTTAITP